MQTEVVNRAERPPHVDDERVVDFDLYDPPGLANGIHAAWTGLKDRCARSLVWTPRHGGHWIALDGRDVFRLYADHELLSSEVTVVPRPALKVPLGAINHNPPEHRDFRILLNAGLSAKKVRALEPRIRELTIELIEGFRTRGECDFVQDFASILPLSVFLSMVDLPPEHREMLMGWVQEITHPSGELDHDAVVLRFWEYLLPIVQERRADPGPDMISDIACGTVFGRPLTDPEAMGACTHLMIAGLDTVASFVGFMMKHLAEHPEQRRLLVERPDMISPAITEFLRRFPMVTMIRLVVKDFELDGAQLRSGDLLALPSILTNLSPDEYADPLAVDFERPTGMNATFGNGVHRCPGSPLARLEIRVILEEWLKRIPEFEYDTVKGVRHSGGFVGTIDALPLRWDVAQTCLGQRDIGKT